MKLIQIESRYESNCRKCGIRFDPGDMVWWDVEKEEKGVVCDNCRWGIA